MRCVVMSLYTVIFNIKLFVKFICLLAKKHLHYLCCSGDGVVGYRLVVMFLLLSW